MKSLLTLFLGAAFSANLLAQSRPTVSIAWPTNGTVVSPGDVTITANANDADGFVAVVKFVFDGQLDEPDSTPPFQFERYVTSGRHMVRAIATNNLGWFTFSTPIYFQVGDNIPVNVLRGPYLQSCTSTSIVVRWRTDWPTNSIVRFGTSFPGTTFSVTNHVRTSEHEVRVTGLTPGTSYFYSIESDAEILAGDEPLVFRAAPTNARPVTVWAMGDSGSGTEPAGDVRDAFTTTVGLTNTDLWLMLGDNAYESGTDDEFQSALFQMYRYLLHSLPLWPTIGNHDTETIPAWGTFPYEDIFTLPQNGEAGGRPSGTERYYSFEYANIHFICLDSESSSRSTGGAMLAWLQEDLAATEKDWIVAFWHHPPYSFGSHDSDTELKLVQMRQNALPILEAYGVDLVLAGHSHVYERTFLLNGHYGHSSSLTTNMIVNSSRGGTAAAYRKPARGLGANGGTVYAVCGCSGQGTGDDSTFPHHPAMVSKTNGYGSMVLRFDGLRMEAQFLRVGVGVTDEFVIDKSGATDVRPHLDIARSISGIALSWPTSLPEYLLESAPVVGSNATWQAITGAPSRVGRRNVVSSEFENGVKFFRLKAAP